MFHLLGYCPLNSIPKKQLVSLLGMTDRGKKNYLLLHSLCFLRHLVVHMEKGNNFLCRLIWMKALQSHFFSLGAYRTGTSQFNTWSKTDNKHCIATLYHQPCFRPQNSTFSSLFMAWEFLAQKGEAENVGARLIPQDFLGRQRHGIR